MHDALLNGLISDKIIQAVCWALLHSIWQGLLAAIIAAVIIGTTRKSTAAVRYNLLTALFVLFLAATGITFIGQILAAKGPSDGTPAPFFAQAGITYTTENFVQTATTDQSYIGIVLRYLNSHASAIVGAWFVFLVLKLVRLGANMSYVQRIRHSRVYAPSTHWKERLAELSGMLGINHHVLLLESALVKIPTVVGLFKPVILVPLGLMSNLPADHLEAVLLHELAHIRRKDYLVNLLQSFAEVIFFFNPPLLWLSELIREERENCCDDIAIASTRDKKQFIHALVAFQEYTLGQSNTSIAIAFAGRKKYLLNRVKRIIYNENKKLNAMEKGILIFSIVAITLTGFISLDKEPVRARVVAASPGTKVITDTIPGKKQEASQNDSRPDEFTSISSYVNKDVDPEARTITATDKTGKRYKIIARNGQPVELYLNDKRIPTGEMEQYERTISAIEEQVEIRGKQVREKIQMDQGQRQEEMMKLQNERSELQERMRLLDEKQAKLYNETLQKYKDHEWENAAESKLLNEKQFELLKDQQLEREHAGELYNKQNQLNLDLLKKELINQNINNEILQQKELFNENNKKAYMDKFFQENVNHNVDQQLFNEKMQFLQNNRLEFQQQQSYVLIDPIIANIVEEGIVPPHQEDMSFELTGNSFIVNGKKQPREVHERFKERFLKKDGDYFKYKRKGGSISTTIHVD